MIKHNDEKESPFDRPGDIRSIPRDGQPKGEDHPDTPWQRGAVDTPQGPDEPDEPFDTTDMLNSVPQSNRPEEVDGDSPTEWIRAKNIPGVPEEDDEPFPRPGDVRSIPRDGKPYQEDSPDTTWLREPDQRIPGVHDEDAPFVHADGKTLFFASNGHTTIGGYDIFKSEIKSGKWQKPFNVGKPVNTPGDDKFYVVSSDGRRG